LVGSMRVRAYVSLDCRLGQAPHGSSSVGAGRT
jgi:hypothetical protein